VLAAACLAGCTPKSPVRKPAEEPPVAPAAPAPAPPPVAEAPARATAPAVRVFLVDEFDGANDRERINHALAALSAAEGEKSLRFSAREYTIEPARLDTFEPVLGGSEIHHATIEGQGAVLVAKDAIDCEKGYFFKINRFSNLTVKNLSLTYRPAPFVQGTIVRADHAGNRTTFRMDPAFDQIDLLRRTPNSEFWCRAGIPGEPLHPKPGSPSWMGVGIHDQGGVAYEKSRDGAVTVQAGSVDTTLALHARLDWRPGDPLVIWKRSAQDGFCFEEGAGLRLENLRVESAPHFALKLRGVSDAVITNCHVRPLPGAMISSGADGIDVQQSRRVRIENCALVATGDDAISFLNHGHGVNGLEFETKFDPPFPETNEDVLLRSNLIEGGNRNGILLLASDAEILGNTVVDTRQYGIKFTGDRTRIEGNAFRRVGTFSALRHITDELDTGIICSDEWVQSNVSIRRNLIEDWSHMPGILLKAVRQAKVAENVFVIRDPRQVAAKPINPYLASVPAICVTGGDGGRNPCADILIRDNVFRSRGGWTSEADAVAVHGDHPRVVVKQNRLLPPGQ